MTIKECKNATLRLLNQYSIADTVVPRSYNDQGDDLNRMLDLINEAQMEIATVARHIEASTTIIVPEVDSNVPLKDLVFTMPADFNHARSIRFTPAGGRDQRPIDASVYRWEDDTTLSVPNRPAGTYTIQYNRFPVHYSDAVDENTELDNTPDTHLIIPYFVAAMIALDDNQKAYYSLYNIWETRLARLNMHDAYATQERIQDVYGFDNFSGVR